MTPYELRAELTALKIDGITQRDIATAFGLQPSSITRWMDRGPPEYVTPESLSVVVGRIRLEQRIAMNLPRLDLPALRSVARIVGVKHTD